MIQFQRFTAWFCTLTLLTSSMGLEACGTKEPNAAATAQAAQAPAAPAAQTGQAAPPAAAPDAAQPAAQMQLPEMNLTPAGLDELMAPIALYPDPVVAVMLQSAVDPQQVMDAGNWLVQPDNQNLKEAALDQATQKAGFTPVVQALLHYPTVVDLMCQNFDWTKQLGSAYSTNPRAVLDSVQRLRAQALDSGALKSSSQMKVDVTQDQGQQVIKLEPGNPKVVYVPQYNPDQVFSQTTTTTAPDGTVTTTTTTSGPAPAATTSSASTSSTTVVKESSGVSTGTAVMIGLLSFGAGIALGAAINSNNYYYPSWGYGGVWYGPRPYYPPPYYPHYYGGWHGGYVYNRPVHYGNTNIYINNNNYYNRFNNNNNLNGNYRPRPVPYSNNPNSAYARNMGSRPAANQGINTATRPAQPNRNINNAPQQRPATSNVGGAQARPQPAGGGNNWKGQSSYQGARPQPGAGSAGGNAGMARPTTGTMPPRNPSGDRGYGQPGGTRPSTGNMQASRPGTANAPQSRPANSNAGTPRPSTGNAPQTRPAANQPAARPAQQPATNKGGAFGGVNHANSEKTASNRGRQSMGAKPAQSNTNHPAPRRK